MLLFMDGFDHYATADISKKWSAAGSSTTVAATSGRRGGGCLSGSQSGSAITTKTIGGTATTIIAGAAFYATSALYALASVTFCPLQFREGATTHVGIGFNSSGLAVAYNGSGTLLGTAASGAIVANAWNYIEAKVVIGTTGSVEVRVNGTTVLLLSSVNTKNGGTGVINTFGLFPSLASGANATLVDDLYVCDSSGTTNNAFLGDCRIDTLLPNGDGSYSAFTPNSGTVHYSRVNEATPDTTSYNDGANVGDRDSYQLADLTSLVSQTVYGVQVNAAITKDDAGTRSAAPFIRTGGANKDGTSLALNTSYAYASTVFETDASSAAFTQTSVNAMEAGVTVTV